MGEKTLCSLVGKNGLDKDEMRKYARLIDQPVYVCEKCGRAANDKKHLCRPVKIRDKHP